MVEYKTGDKVEHVLSKVWLLVLEVEKNKVGQIILKCRTKDLSVVILFGWEVTLV